MEKEKGEKDKIEVQYNKSCYENRRFISMV